jgi:hypothetical protein
MVCADRRDTGTVSGFWIASYLRLSRPGHAGAMTHKARIKIAAGVTALFLAGICAAGLAVRDGRPQAATAAKPSTAPTSKSESGEDKGVAGVLEGVLAAARGDDDSNESERDDDE